MTQNPRQDDTLSLLLFFVTSGGRTLTQCQCPVAKQGYVHGHGTEKEKSIRKEKKRTLHNE